MLLTWVLFVIVLRQIGMSWKNNRLQSDDDGRWLDGRQFIGTILETVKLLESQVTVTYFCLNGWIDFVKISMGLNRRCSMCFWIKNKLYWKITHGNVRNQKLKDHPNYWEPPPFLEAGCPIQKRFERWCIICNKFIQTILLPANDEWRPALAPLCACHVVHVSTVGGVSVCVSHAPGDWLAQVCCLLTRPTKLIPLIV